jgi:hypothetical protein
MNITELDNFNLGDAVRFHRRLNPGIWGQDERMLPEVRTKLLEIAADFQEFLGISDIEVEDITISGSNAAYSYTPQSDIDLHLVVRKPEQHNDVYQELFNAKKYQYNDMHDIRVRGADVELYVQPADQTHVSLGQYSIVNDEWIQVPRRQRASIDHAVVKHKYEDLAARINNALKDDNSERIGALISKIKTMRQSGLDKHGEFGSENLAYKLLRAHGLIQKLYDAQAAARDRELSLNERRKKKKRVRYAYGGYWMPGFAFGDGGEGGGDGGGGESVREDATLTPGGINPSTKMFLEDDANKSTLQQFMQYVISELGIDSVPRTILHKNSHWSEHNHSFGSYDPESNTLHVSLPNRHILDVMRTVAHELVHCAQHQTHTLPSNAGKTGSRWENDANARAGAIMRDFATAHPELFDDPALKESASGYIPRNKKEARDPRYSMAVTVDIKPGQVGKEANKLGLKTNKQGQPQIARASGLFEKLALELSQFKQKGTLDKDLLNEKQTVTRIDSKPITDFNSNLKSYKHTDDWSQSGIDTGDDSYWQKRNITPKVTKGLYAGEPHRTALYATGNAHETRYVEFTQNGQPIVYFDRKDLPKMRARKTYLTVFDAASFKKLPTGEYFSDNPGQPIKQTEIGDPFQYIASQGWIVRVTDNLDKVFKQVQAMHKAGKIAQYGAEGMNESVGQDLNEDEDLDEELIAESIDEVLSEINMSPSSLRQEAARTGAIAGMEFEMIVPNTENDDDGDLEPDYDQDERCRSIQDAYDFFYDGDYNGRREVEQLREQMSNDFMEWLDDKIYRDWERSGDEFLLEWVPENVDESEWNPNDLEGDARAEALADFVSNMHADPGSSDAFDDFREENQDSYDESDWLDAEDLDRMSAIENQYSMSWPHWTTVGGGEASIEDVAQEFENAIGRDTKASSNYHSGRVPRPGPDALHYIVEPDGSLSADSNNDTGLEFVSPPLPIDEILSDLNKVKAWAKEYGCYTNDSTGLHINISVPGYSRMNLDFVKLALLLGDKYVLDSFGRAGNTYAKSALDMVRDRVRGNPDDAAKLLNKMKGNLDSLASKAIHSGITQKYTSINTKDGHIEFRSPGGDWLDENFDQIENTLLRFTVAMSAALNPEAYREEYLKKLYKLLTEDNKDDADTIRYFSEYVAGKIPKAALRSFVKQAQLTRQVRRNTTGGKKMWWSVTNPPQSSAGIEVVATSKEEAIEKALSADGYPSWVNTRQSVVAKPLRPYEEPAAPAAAPANRNTLTPTGPGPWEVFRISDGSSVAELGQTSRLAAEVEARRVIDQRRESPELYGVRTATAAPEPQGVDTSVDYEIYNRETGEVVDTAHLRNDNEARIRLNDYRAHGPHRLNSQQAEQTFGIRRGPYGTEISPNTAPQTLTRPGQGQQTFTGEWQVLDSQDRELYRFHGIGNNQSDANRVAMNWLRQNPERMQAGVTVVPVMS